MDHDGEDAGEKDARLVKLQQRVAGEVDGVVDSEDDEDLDSDAAFEGESDEERFSSFKFALKVRIVHSYE